MEKRGVITDQTPGPAKPAKPEAREPRTKEAADALEDHLATRMSSAVAAKTPVKQK